MEKVSVYDPATGEANGMVIRLNDGLLFARHNEEIKDIKWNEANQRYEVQH